MARTQRNREAQRQAKETAKGKGKGKKKKTATNYVFQNKENLWKTASRNATAREAASPRATSSRWGA